MNTVSLLWICVRVYVCDYALQWLINVYVYICVFGAARFDIVALSLVCVNVLVSCLLISSCCRPQEKIQDQWYCVASEPEAWHSVIPCECECVCLCVCALTSALLLGPEVFDSFGNVTVLSQFSLPLAQLLHIWACPDL